MIYVVIALYYLALAFILMFSLCQLHLTFHYLRRKKNLFNVEGTELPSPPTWPRVTVQLPLYNEPFVVERLLLAITALDYPGEQLEIQVLDDSTDGSVEIIERCVDAMRNEGLDVVRLTRTQRTGFKAGALQNGLAVAKGEYIAIFDADFLPEKDFLKKIIPYFSSDNIGMVQTRWGHLNKDYSLLTRLQAFGLDAHFSIEQVGRSGAGSFINFNGTGGIWRKSCIHDAGGWSADTLTEDLDLSYRAQLRGWKFAYLENVVAPAELPVLMEAIKSQQFRWNKGAAETARKNLPKVLSSSLGLTHKLHAVFHLLNSSIFICILLAGLLSIPLLLIYDAHPHTAPPLPVGILFLIGFISISTFYFVATKWSYPSHPWRYFVTTYPLFLTIFMGLSLHNAWAVLEGLSGIKSPFIRTPKYNIHGKKKDWKKNLSEKSHISVMTVLEGLLCLYFVFGIATGIYLGNFTLIVFHSMLALGYASIFYFSIRPTKFA